MNPNNTTFNYDLERMKAALEGDTITIPKGYRGERLKEYLKQELEKRSPKHPSPQLDTQKIQPI